MPAFAMTGALESLTAGRAEAATMTALANLLVAPFLVGILRWKHWRRRRKISTSTVARGKV